MNNIRKLPRKTKKKIKLWFMKTFPNYPFPKLMKPKHQRLDNYTLSIYHECVAEERDKKKMNTCICYKI